MRALNKDVWPYGTTVHGNFVKAEDWCNEHIGKRYVEWYSYALPSDEMYMYSKRERTSHKEVFSFKKEEDLLLFKIRWNNGN